MDNKDGHSSKVNGDCSPNTFPSIYPPPELSSLSDAQSREGIRKDRRDCGFLEIQANPGNLSSQSYNVDDVHKGGSGDKSVEMAACPHHDAILDSREPMEDIGHGFEDGDDRGSSNTTGLAKYPQEASSNGEIESFVGSPSSQSEVLASKDASGSIHGLSPLEPSLDGKDSDWLSPLEPSVSAPPVILMRLLPGSHHGEEPSSPAPLLAVQADVMQSSSPTASPGLQRAHTLPSGSLENADELERSNDKDDIVRSSTTREKGRRRHHHRADNVRTPMGKLSKRKQKKIIKRIATVNPNGTVEFDVNKSARFGPDLFGTKADEPVEEPWEELPYSGDDEEGRAVPPLQIVMLIVGTRGDVQPFVAIGKHLQEYGHRVRLATHSNFREFVLKAGLEFFPLGGDPKVLAGYMVKNKGFLPSGPLEIQTQRKQIKSIISSLLPACIESDPDGVAFKAQAIIANPPCYGHAHVAEALKVPLHIFFTMPWTPTSEFPHPLSRVHHSAANRLSYQVVDSLIWWGIRDIINDFRKKKLKLRPITYLSGSQPSLSKLPTGYIWSPHLVPKPKDWGPNIDVVGFCFLNMSQDYKPPAPLVSFLKTGAAPIYVGFGSLPLEDPEGMTEIIVEALKETSQRGIIDKGWGGIGKLKDQPDSIYLLDNCPHDWLFPQCAAVVHHGGAGTTAAGLRAACPTTIVPFFGDQPFWGDRVHAKGVGPAPIPAAQFSLDKLVHAINYMLTPDVKQRAVELAHMMEGENGVVGAVNAFHKHLPKGMPLKSDSITSKKTVAKTVADRIAGFRIFSCFGSNMP